MWKLLPDVTKQGMLDLRGLKKAKFYADEDIEEEVVDFLRDNGVNITSARALGHRGKPDSFHAALSYREKRFLLTKNAKHFLNDREVPFSMVHCIVAIEGDMGEMEAYTRTLLSVLDLVSYGEAYLGMKIQVSKEEFSFRFIDPDGRLTRRRMKVEGVKVYEWVES
jgi:predicted nuclease of predicted toxin-antitoxin system